MIIEVIFFYDSSKYDFISASTPIRDLYVFDSYNVRTLWYDFGSIYRGIQNISHRQIKSKT